MRSARSPVLVAALIVAAVAALSHAATSAPPPAPSIAAFEPVAAVPAMPTFIAPTPCLKVVATLAVARTSWRETAGRQASQATASQNAEAAFPLRTSYASDGGAPEHEQRCVIPNATTSLDFSALANDHDRQRLVPLRV